MCGVGIDVLEKHMYYAEIGPRLQGKTPFPIEKMRHIKPFFAHILTLGKKLAGGIILLQSSPLQHPFGLFIVSIRIMRFHMFAHGIKLYMI